MNSSVLTIGAAFLVSLPLMFAARRWTTALDLVDRPDDRKIHFGDVPLAGGPGIVGGAVVLGAAYASFGLPVDGFALQAFVACTIAALVGAVDDKRTIAPRARLVLQFGIALLAATVFGLQVRELGDVFGTGPVSLGPAMAIGFTAFCIVGVINATNMLDGMNGLLSGTAAISLGAMAWLVAGTGDVPDSLLGLYTLGSLLAFLMLNLGAFGARFRIFLGDSGAMFLGVLLALSLIYRSQGAHAVLPAVSAGWILGLPLLDTVVVIVRRLRAGRSPFDAGRDHLHHRLMNLGLSPRRTLATMLLLHGAMVAIGLWSVTSTLAPWAFFYGFVVATVAAFGASFVLDRHATTGIPDSVPVTSGDARRGRFRPAMGAVRAFRRALGDERGRVVRARRAGGSTAWAADGPGSAGRPEVHPGPRLDARPNARAESFGRETPDERESPDQPERAPKIVSVEIE